MHYGYNLPKHSDDDSCQNPDISGRKAKSRKTRKTGATQRTVEND